jgi:glutamyl-tRNA synthetase
MNNPHELISLLFPKPLPTTKELEERFPKRQLPEGAIVTRFAPSPTGFIHIGGVYIAMLGKNLAHHSHGVYFVRIEDTDQNRKVEDFQSHFDEAFNYFNITPDETDENSKWGPYTQSKRSDLYLTFVKYLVENNRAYPCFCTKEALEEQSNKQREAKVDIGYYGDWAMCRNLSPDEAAHRIKSGQTYVIRFKANGTDSTIVFDDLIRGKIKAKDNINDVVILKSSSNDLPLPTYHLAHAVDDHLMRVNLVLRSDEWFPSVPLHFQLFDALGFERIPYAHIAPLMKQDGTSRRKLSKRKDPEASVVYYMEQGYPAKSVIVYLKGLANSRLADTPMETCLAAPIKLNELQKAGALMDMEKLKDISSNYIATMSALEIRSEVITWAQEYDIDLSGLIKNNPDYTLKVIDADRFNNGKVRKDLHRWADFRTLYGYLYNEVFEPVSQPDDQRLKAYSESVIQKLLIEFVNNYEESNDNQEWFENIKKIAELSNFAMNNKEFKEQPERYVGTIREATDIIRIAITGKNSSPNLYDIFNLLGKEEVIRRVKAVLN